MNFIKHFFKRHQCVGSVCIDDSGGGLTPALICKKCNREIGFVYFDGVEWKPLIHVRFKRYKLEIEKWIRKNTKDRNHRGNLYEQEWGKVLHSLKQWHEDIEISTGCEEQNEECEEDNEGGESDGFGGLQVM